jgi:hypothetical protein
VGKLIWITKESPLCNFHSRSNPDRPGMTYAAMIATRIWSSCGHLMTSVWPTVACSPPLEHKVMRCEPSLADSRRRRSSSCYHLGPPHDNGSPASSMPLHAPLVRLLKTPVPSQLSASTVACEKRTSACATNAASWIGTVVVTAGTALQLQSHRPVTHLMHRSEVTRERGE